MNSLKYVALCFILISSFSCSSDDDSNGFTSNDIDLGESSFILENYENVPPTLLEGLSSFGLEPFLFFKLRVCN